MSGRISWGQPAANTTSGMGLIWGSRTALGAGSLVALSSVLIGVIVGAVAGLLWRLD